MEESYRRNKKVTDEFIWKFSEKYDVCMPDDILFNFDIADFLGKYCTVQGFTQRDKR